MEGTHLNKTPQPAHHPRRPVVLELPVPQHDKLARMAKERGLPTPVFALNLFNAAYSARQAPTGDTALDEAVSRIDMAQPDDGEAARWKAEAQRLAAELRSEREKTKEMAQDGSNSLSDLKEERFRRQAAEGRVAELEQAMKGAAVISDHAGACLRERDDRIALLEEAQADKVRGNAKLKEQLDAALEREAIAIRDKDCAELAMETLANEIAALKESLSLRVRELLKARTDLAAAAEETARWQAMARSLGGQLETALLAKEAAQREAKQRLASAQAPAQTQTETQLEPATLTSSQIRMARGLRAAGNSNSEIAKALVVPVAVIEPLFREAA